VSSGFFVATHAEHICAEAMLTQRARITIPSYPIGLHAGIDSNISAMLDA